MVWALLALGPPAGVEAQDRWTEPHPGVRHLYRRASGPREIHALVVDLCRAGISLRATREGENGVTVPSWGSARGVEAAINGDFFSYSTYHPTGAAMGDGRAWGPADHRGSGFLAFGTDRIDLSPDAEIVNPLAGWMRQVVSGKPLILRDGEIVDHGSRELCTVRHPRTAAGFSRDGQTLYLMVVDGRSTRSIGMTCAEEARFLRELGAWNALNLDGGGSSTMWIRGTGVVNRPSDGSPRVVANHLGVHAEGSGIPASCMPHGPKEDELLAGALATTTTDLDGDGRADVCARAGAGVRCHLADGAPFGEAIVGPELSDASGWGDPTNFETIAMGDVNGDGLADLCARGNAGLYCWPSTGSGFGERIAGPALSDDEGWGRPEHYGTIRLADVTGDGLDDVCARGWSGVRCWPSVGDGFEDSWAQVDATGHDAGFADPSKWSTIRLGDVTGDGLADLCARGAGGFDCWASTGVGFDAEPIAGPRWSDDSGWAAHPYYSTIRLVDLDGDGLADVCGRGAAGLRCHLSDGAGFGDPIVLDAMADDRGWRDIRNYSTLAFADVDGDGRRDACARGDAGISCWPFLGDRFGEVISGPTLSDESGWARAFYYRTIRFADVDGDGDDDVCARAAAGLRCWLSDAGAFGDSLAGPEWSDELGWWPDRFHSTIRLAGPRRAPAMEEPDPADGPDGGAASPAPDGGATIPGGGDGGAEMPGSRGSGGMTGGCAAAGGGPGAPVGLLLFLLALVLRRAPRG